MKSRLTHFLIIILAALIGHFIAYKLIHVPGRLELVAILSLLLFYPILRRPLIGIYAVFIISPFIPFIRRLYYLLYERPSIDPLIIIGDLFLAFILLGLFFEFRERRGRDLGTALYIRIVVIYFLYLLVRTFFFNYLPVSDALAKFKYYGPPVLFFFIGIVYADKNTHLKKFWYITIAIGIITSLYGFNQLYNGYLKAEMIWFSSIEFSSLFIKGIPRPFSIFQAPVAFADYAQLSIIGILMCLAWIKNKLYFVLLFLIPIFLYAALITSVRSSWIGIIVTFFVWFIFFRIKSNSRRFFTLAGILIVYIVCQFTIETFESGLNLRSAFLMITKPLSGQQHFELLVTERATALYNPLGEHSFLSRLTLWKNLIAYSKDPVLAFLGRGVGTLKADSLYFTYLAEFGYPGLFFIIAILVGFILKGFYIIDTSNNPDIIVLAKGITVMNIVFAVVSITGTHIHYFPGDIYFWFWNGVLIQLSALIKPDMVEEEMEVNEV